MKKLSRFVQPVPPNRMMLRRALFLMGMCGIVAFGILAARLFTLQIIKNVAKQGNITALTPVIEKHTVVIIKANNYVH